MVITDWHSNWQFHLLRGHSSRFVFHIFTEKKQYSKSFFDHFVVVFSHHKKLLSTSLFILTLYSKKEEEQIEQKSCALSDF